MDQTAPNNQKTKVLITNTSSYLGEKLALYLLSQNYQIYGVAKSRVSESLVINQNFTLLDINLDQPIPDHIAKLDLIIHLATEQNSHGNQISKHLTAQTTNIISTATSHNIKLVIILSLFQDTQIFESYLQNDNVNLFLVGDIYGPNMPNVAKHTHLSGDIFSHNKLSLLINEAVLEDKLILEKEGQKLIYPTYIDDATNAIYKFINEDSQKQIRFIISESAKKTLDVAYVIQSALAKIASKDIKLYFAGETEQTIESETSLKIPELKTYTPTELSEGLEIVFKQSLQNMQIENANFQGSHQTHHTTKLNQEESTAKYEDEPNQKKPKPKKSIVHNKKMALLLLFIIMFFIGKNAYSFTAGIKNLKSTENLLKNGEFEKASTNARVAASQLTGVQSTIDFITTPYSAIFPKKTGISNALEATISTSKSISDFANAAKILSSNLSAIAQTEAKGDIPSIDDAQASLQKAFFESSQALNSAQKVQGSKFMFKYVQPKIESIQKMNSLIGSTNEFTHLIGDIAGTVDLKTYLILLQNNAELRPGGGFIGNYGIISFQDGHLKEIKVNDIYQIDGQLKEKIEPPKQLKDKLGVDNFYLRDSNWVPDFGTNAQTARDFYKKETGQSVDGVIAIDLYLIQNILKVTGPIKLTDYNEEITAQNIFERGEYYAEIGFFPGSTQKKDFFSSLTRALISKVTDNITGQRKDNFSLVSLAQSLNDSLSQKHLMLALDSPNLTTFTKHKGWDNSLPPQNFDPSDDSFETRDFLSISEANVGANKVNNELERKIDYDLTVGRDADLVAKLKITYTNKSQANTWPSGTYVNFLRLYVPLGATPFEVKNNDKTDIKDIQIANQKNLTVLSTYVEVPIKSTREFSITYRIPKNIKLEKAPTYHMYFQKQPGTDSDQLNFTFNLPNYLAIKSINSNPNNQGKQNINIQTNLSEDRQFVIDITKK